MSRLTDIQDIVAKEKGFTDFKHLLENETEMEMIKCYFNDASKRYARECCEASLEKASETATYDYDQINDWTFVNKESITQESNIILL